MNFLQSFSYTFITKIVAMAFLLLSRILLARLLGPSELGSFGNALNLTTFIARWSSLGTVPATQLIAAQYADRKNEVLTITLMASLILGILSMASIYAIPVIQLQFSDDVLGRTIFDKLTPFLPVLILSMTLSIFLLGRGDYKAYTFSQVIPLVIQTGTLGFAFTSKEPITLVVGSQIGYWILMAGISWFPNRLPGFRLSLNFEVARHFMRVGFKMFPLVILQYGLARFSILTGSHYLSAKELGHFILAANLSEAFLILYTAMAPIVFNQTLKSPSSPTLLIEAIRISNMIIAMILVSILAAGKPVFLNLFGEAYHLSWSLLIMLSPGIILHGIATLSINYFVATQKVGVVMYIYAAGIITLFVSSIFLCPRYGVTGLCAASVLSSLMTAFICICLIRRQASDQFSSLLLPQKDDWNNLVNWLSQKR